MFPKEVCVKSELMEWFDLLKAKLALSALALSPLAVPRGSRSGVVCVEHKHMFPIHGHLF